MPYDKELVKNAARVNADEDLSSTEEDRLYGDGDGDGDGVFDDVKDTAVGRDTSGLTSPEGAWASGPDRSPDARRARRRRPEQGRRGAQAGDTCLRRR